MRLVRLVFLLLLSFGAPGASFAQDADEPAEFKEITGEAEEAYERGDYDGAVALFKKAYEMREVSNILYNIARIYEDAGNIDGAIEYYDKFVVAPNVAQGPRKDALERLKTLREVKKMQEAPTPPPDAEVEDAVTAPPPQEPRSNTGRTVGWVLVGVGGAALVTSAVFAVLTQSRFDDFESAATLDARRRAASAGRTDAVLADVLLIGGGVSALTGAIFLIASSGGSERNTSWNVAPLVGRDGLGIALDWHF